MVIIIYPKIKGLPEGGIGLHCVKAFPVKPSMQTQTEMCFVTRQIAFIPHDPGQGSAHFWLLHARLLGHSSLIVH